MKFIQSKSKIKKKLFLINFVAFSFGHAPRPYTTAKIFQEFKKKKK